MVAHVYVACVGWCSPVSSTHRSSNVSGARSEPPNTSTLLPTDTHACPPLGTGEMPSTCVWSTTCARNTIDDRRHWEARGRIAAQLPATHLRQCPANRHQLGSSRILETMWGQPCGANCKPADRPVPAVVVAVVVCAGDGLER